MAGSRNRVGGGLRRSSSGSSAKAWARSLAYIHPEHHASGRVAARAGPVTDGGARRRRDDVAPEDRLSGRRPAPSPEGRRCVSRPGASRDPSLAASSKRRSAPASRRRSGLEVEHLVATTSARPVAATCAPRPRRAWRRSRLSVATRYRFAATCRRTGSVTSGPNHCDSQRAPPRRGGRRDRASTPRRRRPRPPRVRPRGRCRAAARRRRAHR